MQNIIRAECSRRRNRSPIQDRGGQALECEVRFAEHQDSIASNAHTEKAAYPTLLRIEA
jgi:hypothetical protein